ncbi:MAG: non-canonical purine NTP diphosphatase [Bacteroidetes bacterium]|nr:non-canonical purine NTP diphosphatase [Bacteroidota bacterium]
MSTETTKLVFATNNRHKLKEIRSMLSGRFEVLSLEDIGCEDELPETSATLEGNAMQKATYVFEKFGWNCFADDTGLEIVALNGRPGVYSARFAGANCNERENVEKVLIEMKGVQGREARFKTVIALIIGKERKYVEGVVEGTIALEPGGDGGFGYDPVFIPTGNSKTFAEMNPEEKNKISHRGKALEKLVEYLAEVSNVR